MEVDTESNRKTGKSGLSDTTSDVCECDDSLDIFERCVQDPCSDAWEGLDEEASDCDDEDVLLEGVQAQYARAVPVQARQQTSGNSENTDMPRCSTCHRLRRWKKCADCDEPMLRCSRTSSFMVQLSRQASRQSMPDAPDNALPSPTHHNLDASVSSRSRSRSSFSGSAAIPTHLYCLERFVSSELDSATAEFFEPAEPTVSREPHDETPQVARSPELPFNASQDSCRSKSSCSSPSNSDTSPYPGLSNAAAPSSKNSTYSIPSLIHRRKSRVSSIEVSLLNSMT
ncbi:LAMI_0G04038g1_1 [Lachancea mirantina]|uniref:LAMI_0G04038g1_1 n=1 Tax=Lachancea mirantina TaxID=1230905 RepID=A0A1G4K8C3_9SACH|nr:LAMI_0G04038g1_1 [Lachancea mirantina]